jgi:hypothetical protein
MIFMTGRPIGQFPFRIAQASNELDEKSNFRIAVVAGMNGQPGRPIER